MEFKWDRITYEKKVNYAFSRRSRGVLSGITAAINSVFAFCLTNVYWDVVAVLTLPWTMIAYSIIGAIGLPYIYYKLPETENKTLQQIQKELQRS